MSNLNINQLEDKDFLLMTKKIIIMKKFDSENLFMNIAFTFTVIMFFGLLMWIVESFYPLKAVLVQHFGYPIEFLGNIIGIVTEVTAFVWSCAFIRPFNRWLAKMCK